MRTDSHLVALSGDTASFLPGCEFPIPVPSGLGTVSIEYKRYGVGLAFTPTVLRDGVINLKIEPEVSQLDTSHPVQVAGISVPPLIVRRARPPSSCATGSRSCWRAPARQHDRQEQVLGRRPAGARRAVPRCLLSEGDRPRHR